VPPFGFISNYYIINIKEDNHTFFNKIIRFIRYWFKALFVKGSIKIALLKERGLFKPVKSLLK